MDELYQQLEIRFEMLMQKCRQLEHDNYLLKQNQALLTREKEMLLTKNKMAISQIENMVARLKSIETAQ